MKEVVAVISMVFPFFHLVGDWWNGVSITGNVIPQIVPIGQPVTISCDVQGCTSSSLQVHLTKWEDFKNQTLYMHSSLQKHKIKGSKTRKEDKEGTQVDNGTVVVNKYKNGLFQVTLPQVELSSSGQYVCGVQCNDTYKEAVLDVIVKGMINVAVPGAAIFPSMLSGSHDHSYLKLQWKKISPGKSHTLVIYLYQATCPAFCLQDIFRERRTCSNRPSPRIWLRKQYKHRIEIPRGDLSGKWNTSLKLNNVQVEDAGEYKCLVESKSLHKVVIFDLSVKGRSSQNTENWPWHFGHVLCLLIISVATCCFVERNEKIRQLNIKNEGEGAGTFTVALHAPPLRRGETTIRNSVQDVPPGMEASGQPVMSIERHDMPAMPVVRLQTVKRGIPSWLRSRRLLTQEKSGHVIDDREETEILRTEVEELKKTIIELEKYKRMHIEICDPEGFLAWTRAFDDTDTITLDADSAHPCIFIEKRSFTHGTNILPVPPKPQCFDGIVAVLGVEGFSSGNHYWQVDIGNSSDWDVGVARKSIKRKGNITLSPKEGFWVLGFTGRDYFAKTDPWTRITVQRKPEKIGIHLRFQENKVTFFSVTSKSILFEFKQCEFSEKIYPFFKNGDKGKTMHLTAK